MESQVKSPVKAQALDLQKAVEYAKLVNLADAVYHVAPKIQPALKDPINPPAEAYQKAIDDPTYAGVVDADFLKNYNLLYSVQMNDDTLIGIQLAYFGFVAQSKQPPYNYVMAIRGTEAGAEWFDDDLINPLPFNDVKNGGNAVAGFLTLFESGLLVKPSGVDSSTLPLLKLKDVAKNPTWAMPDAGKVPTVICGHSLGCALATLYAISTANNSGGQSGDLTVYTYASPMVGDQTFVNTYNNSPLQNYRICNIKDKVPTLPVWLKDFKNEYVQVNGEYPIDSSKYPEIYHETDNDKDQGKTDGCAHILPTYIYILEKLAGMKTDQNTLDVCGCLSPSK